jgi:hypothetical protein
MMEELNSSETSVLTRAKLRNIPKDGILYRVLYQQNWDLRDIRLVYEVNFKFSLPLDHKLSIAHDSSCPVL